MQPQPVPTTRLSPAAAATCAAPALIRPTLAGMLWGPQHLRSGLWYGLLRKPAFQPPDAAIPLVWTVINSWLAAGAYRLLRQPGSAARTRALGWWGLNVALVGGWTGVFFGRRNLPAATALAAAMVGTGAACVVQAGKVDVAAARSGLPCVGWGAFATVLTATLWSRNR